MKKILEKKQELIKKINLLAEKSISTMIIDYSKIKSIEIKYIRKSLHEKKINVKVLKNTIAKKALTNTQNEKLCKDLIGQTLLIFSENDIVTPIKTINKLKKKYNNIKIKSICIYSNLFSGKHINDLINLPTKKQAIANLNIKLKLPIIKLINYLKYPHTRLNLILKSMTNNQK